MSDHKHVEEVLSRLSKIEGHIRGIKKMLEEDQPCDKVLFQLSAVKSALNKATMILLDDHFDHCLLANAQDMGLRIELLEFKKILDGFVK